jgi:hypothetical protein
MRREGERGCTCSVWSNKGNSTVKINAKVDTMVEDGTALEGVTRGTQEEGRLPGYPNAMSVHCKTGGDNAPGEGNWKSIAFSTSTYRQDDPAEETLHKDGRVI